MKGNDSETIWTRSFVLLCLAQFLSYAHHTLLTPTLPLYVTHLGGTPFLVGIILAVFCATSVVVRPTIGYWADAWSYAGILSLGSLLLGLSVLLYLLPLAAALIVSNAFRGIGWAGLNTGGYSLLAVGAPDKRRGEASGYYSSFQSCAHVLFPAVALWLLKASWGGFQIVILLSAALALAGSALALLLKGPQRAPALARPPAAGEGRPKVSALVDRNVLVAAALLLCIYLTLPATTSFLVLYAEEIGVGGMGWYFVASGVTHVLARPLLGRLSDRIGRGYSISTAFFLELAGLILLLVAADLTVFVAGGVLYAAGTALGTSSTMAMAIAVAEPERRGVAMATFSTAYPLSVGLGAILTGAVVEIAGFTWMFMSAILMWVAGFAVMVLYWSTLNRTSPVT